MVGTPWHRHIIGTATWKSKLSARAWGVEREVTKQIRTHTYTFGWGHLSTKSTMNLSVASRKSRKCEKRKLFNSETPLKNPVNIRVQGEQLHSNRWVHMTPLYSGVKSKKCKLKTKRIYKSFPVRSWGGKKKNDWTYCLIPTLIYNKLKQ